MCSGCSDNAATSPCALDISHNSIGTTEHYDKYNDWASGDSHLDWYGAESGQGQSGGMSPLGTPMAWTSDDPSSAGYQELNKSVQFIDALSRLKFDKLVYWEIHYYVKWHVKNDTLYLTKV